MALNDHRTEAFSQSTILRNNHPYKKDAQGGICFALCVQWMKDFGSAGHTTAVNRMAALRSKFGTCIHRQEIFSIGKTGTSPKQLGQWAALMTGLGRLFGFSFKAEYCTDTYMELCDYLVDPTRAGARYLLTLTLPNRGGHAVGIRGGGNIVVYDPNFGEFSYAANDGDSFDFWCDYDMEYGMRGKQISRYTLYRITAQQSVFDFWKNR